MPFAEYEEDLLRVIVKRESCESQALCVGSTEWPVAVGLSSEHVGLFRQRGGRVGCR